MVILLTCVGRFSPININPIIYLSIIIFIIIYFYFFQIKFVEKTKKFYLIITLLSLFYIVFYYLYNLLWYGSIKTYLISKASSPDFTYYDFVLVTALSDIVFALANIGMLTTIYTVFLKLIKLKINKLKIIKFSCIYIFSCIVLMLVYMFIAMKLLMQVDMNMLNIIIKIEYIVGYLFKILFIYIYFLILSKNSVLNENKIIN